jgi:exopolyphosphatase/guanosine-5'-triphosphate,3'-diphosphate pyrophosphatase
LQADGKVSGGSGCAGATSATRESKNGKGFVKRIYDNLGIDIRIISGPEEARLILKGIQSFEPLAIGTFAFVDIGGGSTEVGVSREGETLYLESFPIGAARLSQKLSMLPASGVEIEQVRKEIRYCLQQNFGFKDWPKVEFLLGASGTVKALLRMMKEFGDGKKLSRNQLKEVCRRMSVMSVKEIEKIPGMEKRRADIIFPGAMILEELMDFLGAKRIARTKFALREGLLQEELEAMGLTEDRTEIRFEDQY